MVPFGTNSPARVHVWRLCPYPAAGSWDGYEGKPTPAGPKSNVSAMEVALCTLHSAHAKPRGSRLVQSARKITNKVSLSSQRGFTGETFLMVI